MKLKKLELQGFKSFVDKTEIVYLDGVTAIVGPNGSGKSNISDAIRWVLGEQSVKTLRGSKMEDVIFAGTIARKKVGFAEVSMYLDNSDGTLQLEYKEVKITRRVYRNGESNYLINGNECRLKDIQELFMDTGIGKDGYSIISQGKIDEILSTKSEERRHIFEEASGIVKYRTKKDEAVKKLDNTQLNLSRVSDILVEIEKSLDPLESQSKVAKKYLELREKLKSLDVKLFIDSINKSTEVLNNLDDIISTFSNDILNEENLSNNLETKKQNFKEKIQEIDIQIENAQNKFFETENETEKINSKINVSNASIINSKENISRLDSEIKEDLEKIELLRSDIDKRIQKKESLAENRQKFENELQLKQDELDEIMKTLNKRDEQITKIKDEIDNYTEEVYNLKSEVSTLLATIDSNNERIEENKKNLDKNITQKDKIISDIQEVVDLINKENSKLTEINKKHEIKLEELANYNKEYEILSKSEAKLKQELITSKSRYNYLINLDNENEGYYKSVKGALDFAKNNNISGVYGTLASIISTDKKYEYAIEIALGGYLQNIVIEDDKIAKQIIEYLKINNVGRVTFLPLSSIKKIKSDVPDKIKNMPGVLGVAKELIKYDKKYEDVIDLSLFNTIIVDSIDNAILISKKFKNDVKIVTIAGELIATSGSITGGKTTKTSAGLIGRKEKIQELKNEIFNMEIKYNEENKKLEEFTNSIKVLKENEGEILTEKNNLQVNIATLNQRLEILKSEEQKMLNSKASYSNVIEELTLKNKENNDIVENINKKIVSFNEELSKKQEIVQEYSRFNKEKSQIITNLHDDIVNLKVSISSFDESTQSIDEMKEKLSLDISNFETSINKKRASIVSLKNNIATLEDEIVKLNEENKNKIEFKKEFNKILSELKDSKNDILKQQENLELNISENINKINKLKDEKSKVESKKIKYEVDIENLKNKMWDDYELTVTSAKEILKTLPEIDGKNLTQKIDKLKKEIKDLGDVNVGSIEEYNSAKERFDFINTQKDDLEKTKAKLQNLISNITSIMKNQFSSQFKLINENFNETFKELFGGGKAELKLSDENDILNSGIEIEVQPPGKKLQSMMLLSGGERALTAIALLFAILKLKSAPFCILDEIEAALDDVNVHRFAEYIKNYSNNTQFIVITHRKGTMEVASSVYGVTMQEYGVSKIVSIKMK